MRSPLNPRPEPCAPWCDAHDEVSGECISRGQAVRVRGDVEAGVVAVRSPSGPVVVVVDLNDGCRYVDVALTAEQACSFADLLRRAAGAAAGY